MSSGSQAIDHGTTADNHEMPDTNADAEGALARENPQAGNQDRNPTPVYVLDEFQWILRSGVLDTPEARVLDKNWQMRPLPTTVAKVVAMCAGVLEGRRDDIRTHKDHAATLERYKKSITELLRDLTIDNQWTCYGMALGMLAQGAKEVASAARFAAKANDWQMRLNAENDTENDGPTNMIGRAIEQSLIGTVIIDAVLSAYNEVVTDENAIELKVDERTFTTAAYTALGIEANKLSKQWAHPGKAQARVNASAEAASIDMQAFLGAQANRKA